MKKIAKWLCLLMSVICIGAALIACGDDKDNIDGKYKYSTCAVELVNIDRSDIKPDIIEKIINDEYAEADYMFRVSTLEIDGSVLKWIVVEYDDEGSLTVTIEKAGDKYNFSDDIHDDELGDIYGVKTKGGFALVMSGVDSVYGADTDKDGLIDRLIDGSYDYFGSDDYFPIGDDKFADTDGNIYERIEFTCNFRIIYVKA